MREIDKVEQAFAQIEQSLRDIEDPVERLQACDRVHWLTQVLMTGGNGKSTIRQEAAAEAIRKLGLLKAAKAGGYLPSTLKRVASS